MTTERAFELRVTRTASTTAPKLIRHELDTFLKSFSLADERREDIVLAVGEALANAAEHAYVHRPARDGDQQIELIAIATPDGSRIAVEVRDSGCFIERATRFERGFGFRIMRSIAREVAIDVGQGTRVRLTFEQ
jgi:anti-sigma regulatory factor (Ser/Thr protein kinase)